MQIKGKLQEQPECTSLIGPSPVRSIKYKGVDFTNIFTDCFYPCKFQKRKKTVKSSVSFVLLGSGCTKAARKTLVKSTHVVNITNL